MRVGSSKKVRALEARRKMRQNKRSVLPQLKIAETDLIVRIQTSDTPAEKRKYFNALRSLRRLIARLR